jgi:hypothetical protein
MRILVDLSFTFLSIGFAEAVIKPLAKRFVERRIRAAAPVVLAELDRHLPELLKTGGRKAIESFVRDELEAVTGQAVRQGDVERLFTLFDPRVTGDRLEKG